MTISSNPARQRSPFHRHRRVALAGLLCAGLAVTSGAIVQGAVAAPQPGGATQHVIVLLRNQHTEAPATHADASRRLASTDADQSSLVKDARSHGGKSIRQLHVLNAFSVTASATEVAHLAANPAVAQVLPDRLVAAPTQDTVAATASAAASAARAATSSSGSVPTSVCPADPSKPQLEPEALGLTNTAFDNPATPSAQQLATGKGVKVAFLADGIDINNPDFHPGRRQPCLHRLPGLQWGRPQRPDERRRGLR